MVLLVPAHPDCPGQNPQSRKMIVYVCELSAIAVTILFTKFENMEIQTTDITVPKHVHMHIPVYYAH